MSRGKHLSLEEARKEKRLDQFAVEHPSQGNEQVFDALLETMSKSEKPKKT